ncbi:hypothetical protein CAUPRSCDRAFT_10948 [Caulochytrium protostelioides]|uniref:Uncharacterized protein n=1 Tax=Caulochytrium protostelioides TaxID=1555241 RepID=A0A4P9X0Y9_9FUNG|nr:hypothetical protein CAUPRSCDRAFT_10948 [Caulochytrium protostelioides]
MRYAAWRHGTLLAVLALLGPRSGPLMTARGEINRDVSSPNSDFHALHDLPALEPSKAQSLIRHMATPQGSHGGAGTDTDADMFVGTDTDTVIALYNQHQRRAVHEKLASGIRESPELEKVVMLLQTEINHLTGRAYWTATQAGAFVSAIDSGVSQHLSRALGAHAEHMAAAGVNPVVLLDADVRQVYSQQATVRLCHAASEHLAAALQHDPAFDNDAAAYALLRSGAAASTASLAAPSVPLAHQLNLAVATAMIASLRAWESFTMEQFTTMALATTTPLTSASPPSTRQEHNGVHLERRSDSGLLGALEHGWRALPGIPTVPSPGSDSTQREVTSRWPLSPSDSDSELSSGPGASDEAFKSSSNEGLSGTHQANSKAVNPPAAVGPEGKGSANNIVNQNVGPFSPELVELNGHWFDFPQVNQRESIGWFPHYNIQHAHAIEEWLHWAKYVSWAESSKSTTVAEWLDGILKLLGTNSDYELPATNDFAVHLVLTDYSVEEGEISTLSALAKRYPPPIAMQSTLRQELINTFRKDISAAIETLQPVFREEILSIEKAIEEMEYRRQELSKTPTAKPESVSNLITPGLSHASIGSSANSLPAPTPDQWRNVVKSNQDIFEAWNHRYSWSSLPESIPERDMVCDYFARVLKRKAASEVSHHNVDQAYFDEVVPYLQQTRSEEVSKHLRDFFLSNPELENEYKLIQSRLMNLCGERLDRFRQLHSRLTSVLNQHYPDVVAQMSDLPKALPSEDLGKHRPTEGYQSAKVPEPAEIPRGGPKATVESSASGASYGQIGSVKTGKPVIVANTVADSHVGTIESHAASSSVETNALGTENAKLDSLSTGKPVTVADTVADPHVNTIESHAASSSVKSNASGTGVKLNNSDAVTKVSEVSTHTAEAQSAGPAGAKIGEAVLLDGTAVTKTGGVSTVAAEARPAGIWFSKKTVSIAAVVFVGAAVVIFVIAVLLNHKATTHESLPIHHDPRWYRRHHR